MKEEGRRQMSRYTVFVSYCRADKQALQLFMPFKTTLEQEGLITVWTDARQIKPGDPWRPAIEAALAQSRVAVLFISENFLASRFIRENELPPLLAACESGRLTVLPIFLSPSTVGEAGIPFVHPETDKPAIIKLTEFQGFGTLDETLAEMSVAAKQRVFVNLSKRIRELAQQAPPDPETTGTAPSAPVSGGKKAAASTKQPPVPPQREEGGAQPAPPPIRPTVDQDLNQKAEAFIQAVYASASKLPGASDQEYQKIFAEEGERKSRHIVDFLRKKQEKGALDLKNCRFLSIGGADGSEAESVLRQTDIPEGALIEISTYAANLARQRAVRLRVETGKILHVKEGDAAQSLEEVIGWLKPDGHLCLVTSIQAVLHELQTRSPLFKTPGYDFSVFFGKLFRPFLGNIFFAREPVKPEQWPERVKIHIPGLSGEHLCRLAQIVHDRMRFTCANPEQNPDDYVLMDATLAVETLHKFLRSKDPQEFKYELGEQLTRLNTVELKALIGSSLNESRAVVTESFTTEGFAEQFLEFQVQAKKIKKSTELGIPITHARFVACKLVPSSRQEEKPKSPEKPKSSEKLAEQAEEVSPAKPGTEPFRRADREIRYQKLEQLVATAIKASGAVMDLLEKELPPPVDGNRAGKVDGPDRAMGLTKRIMASPFNAGYAVLLSIFKKMEENSEQVGIDAIKTTSRLLIPWLYVASRKMEIDQWEYGLLGDIRTIPAGIMAFAEIVLAGIDNRAVAWKEISDPLCFPQGFYGVNFQPEGGIKETTESDLREDLFKMVKPPAEAAFEGENEKDDAITRRINWLFTEKGIRVYLISRMPKGEAGDRYKAQIERIKGRYPVLAVVMLDTKLMGEHQSLFDEIRSLLL